MANPTVKAEGYLRFIEILLGLLVLVVGIIYLAPLKYLGFGNGVQMLVLWSAILGLILIAIAVFKLIGASSYGLTGVTNQINIATSILIIATSLGILFIQFIAPTNSEWLHLLFGVALLSYAIGRLSIGALSKDYSRGSRAFILGVGSAVGVLSVIVILFNQILISESGNHTQGVLSVSLSFGYFVIVAFILMGADFLVTSSLRLLLKRHKQSPLAKSS